MSLSVGIVGLPNAGKSTLFNALVLRRQATVGIHPFTTIKPNTGVVTVPDDRLEKLSKLLKPAKSTATSITFIDIAGLVKGSHLGEGLGNEFLSQIRGVDAICHVVREFDDPSVTHVMGSIDPTRDKDIVQTELLLKDIETLVRAKEVKNTDKVFRETIDKLLSFLNQGKAAKEADLKKEEEDAVQHIQLLTAKPIFYVLNVGEKDFEEIKTEIQKIAKKFEPCVLVSAKLEEEFVDLEESERSAYRHELGLRGSSLDRIIETAYSLLGLITFYTVKGAEKSGEVRAWSIAKGADILTAAGKVHTDFAKGFISAEVIQLGELIKYGGFKQAKETGKLQLEGRDYLLKDGDVIEIKANV